MSRKIFINLPVRDLEHSKSFFEQLGFRIKSEFCDASSACIQVSETIFVMLLIHKRFQDFTPKAIADTAASTEVLLALSCESRDEVDDLVARAVAAGGSTYKEPDDHGFMYGHGFQDPDGHIWEVFYMDMGQRLDEEDKEG